jgi:hypothetical protein
MVQVNAQENREGTFFVDDVCEAIEPYTVASTTLFFGRKFER